MRDPTDKSVEPPMRATQMSSSQSRGTEVAPLARKGRTGQGGPSHSFETRSQAPAWERLSSKLCFAKLPTNCSGWLPGLIPQTHSPTRHMDDVGSGGEAELRGYSVPNWSLGLRSPNCSAQNGRTGQRGPSHFSLASHYFSRSFTVSRSVRSSSRVRSIFCRAKALCSIPWMILWFFPSLVSGKPKIRPSSIP